MTEFQCLGERGGDASLFRSGARLLYGSKRAGVRQLYVMRLGDRKEWRITDLAKGRAAVWVSWQPSPVTVIHEQRSS